MNKELKRWLPDVLAVVFFALLAFAYFFPADKEGRILYQHDTSAGAGANQEIGQYRQQTGEVSRWTNSLFGGMPTYQISPSYSSDKAVTTVEKAYHLWLPSYVWHLFAYLLGFYILLRAFDFKQYLAALGSIFWAFSTYFLIIIAAGHMWKVMALAYLPPMIAGIVLAYRGKYLWGLIVTALFAALEIHANHMQMTYYYLFVIFFMVVAYGVEAFRQKRLAHWLKATGVCIVGGLLGVLVNLSNLYHTWEYSRQTMRGGTELSKDSGQASTDGGLNREYITQWSYGIDETLTLLIPNAKGGASGRLSFDEDLMKEYADPQAMQYFREMFNLNPYQNFNTYWGTQPFTAGPVYVGAFVLALFILGLFLVKGPMKWALLAATILTILLSWGKNFMGLTDFFIDHFPMYAKFRTVSSILVVAEFTIPLLAVMTLKKIIEEPAYMTKRLKYVYAVFGVMAGLCLLFAIAPEVYFSLTSSDMGGVNATINNMSSQIESSIQRALAERPDVLEQVITQYRSVLPGLSDSVHRMHTAMLTADCWRSFFVILIGFLLLMLYRAKKLKALPLVGLLAVLCLVDLWQVNKRYLNDAMFVDADIRQTSHAMKPVNKAILQDSDPNFRVLNFTSDTFNENETSYYHKSVGGYHAAKLGRYNELITAYIGPEMDSIDTILRSRLELDSIDGGAKVYPVINMLNTKYFILSDEWAQTNPFAFGNAWFVDRVNYVADANEELAALGRVDLQRQAVADKQFEKVLGQAAEQDSLSNVQLTSYAPNHLEYDVESTKGGVLVFSEIYYPAWTATVDGRPVELGRVNYVLRAMHIDGGKHKVVLDFHPKTVNITETIAYIAIGMFVLLVLAIIFLHLRRQRKHENK